MKVRDLDAVELQFADRSILANQVFNLQKERAALEAALVAQSRDRAQVIREERDALALAWLNNTVQSMTQVEMWLNDRIAKLGIDTVTGDTTEGN